MDRFELQSIRGKLVQANQATDNFLEQANNTETARINFVNALVEYCNITGDFLTNETGFNVSDAINYNGTAALIAVNNTMNNYTSITEEVTNINSSLYDLTEDLAQAGDTVDGLDHSWLFPVATAFIALIDVVVIVFMAGVILAWKKQQPRLFYDCTTKFALPIFILLLLVAYVFSLLALVAATVGADFCIDTPDNQVMEIFAPGFSPGPPAPFDEFLNYYVRVSFEPRAMTDFLRECLVLSYLFP